MDSALDFIFSRRSIRKYTNETISDEILNSLMEAAMAAPSAMTKDPWHFIVIRDRDTLHKMTEVLPNGQMLKQAGAAIIVCGDINAAYVEKESYMLQDCSASIQNILLAANALGLGACWLGMHPREDRIKGIRGMFSLPENIIPISGISIGWPDESKGPRTRYTREKVHRERW